MPEDIKNLTEALEKCVRPATFPVAVKLAVDGDVAPQKARRPARDLGNPLAACKGLNLARTLGWTVIFAKEDHACPVGSIIAGHIEPDLFLDGFVSDLYQDDIEVSRKMESGYPRHPVGSINEIWLSPLDRCEYEPDVAVVYGNPAQILTLIQAANYGLGTGIDSTSTGRVGCSAWIAGAIISNECTYSVPGFGERVFAGTQDHEMCFIIPRTRFASMSEALGIMRKKGAYRYPVPNMNLTMQSRMPEKYYKLFPE